MNNVTCLVLVHCQIDNFWMFFQIKSGDFRTFCHFWRSAGHNTEMLESPAECGQLGNYAFVIW